MDAFEGPTAGGNDVGEAGWVGHADAETFFDDCGEIG